MSEDYYKVLGIGRSATEGEIQKAYRDLARKYHPDLNPDDKTAKEKFQAVQRAYEVLSDKEQRELYDRYGSAYEQMGSGGGRGPGPQPGGFSAEDFDFSQIFGGGPGGGPGAGPGGFSDLFRHFSQGGRRAGRSPVKGRSLRHEVSIPFQTSVTGGEAKLAVQRGDGKVESITIKVPAGIEDGKTIRLKGQGEPSPSGGPAGDILLNIKVGKHPLFQRRDSRDLEIKVPISLLEAVEGANIDVPTPYGTISLKVPPGTSSGKKLRVKGHGVKQTDGSKGDLYAELQIVLPSKLNGEFVKQLRELNVGPANPRADLRW